MTRQRHRFLRVVLRLDQAGSAVFIVGALAAALVLAIVGPVRLALLVLGVSVIAYAAALALLGVCMAYGLVRAASRGEEVSPQLWRSILMYGADR